MSRYFRYIQRTSVSQIGWFIILIVGFYCLLAGFYKGPVEMSDSVYEARVIKSGIFKARRSHHRNVATLHIQGNQDTQRFSFGDRDRSYPDFVQALRVIRPGDRVIPHIIVSNYYPEQMWKLERLPAGAIFLADRDEIWREVITGSTAEAAAAEGRTTFFLMAVAIFVLSEVYGFRKNGPGRIFGSRVVYKASKGFYLYTAVILAITVGLMLFLSAIMVHNAKIQATDPWVLLAAGGTLVSAGFAWWLWRTSRTIKHDLVLTREGLHYPELLEKHGIDFIPWSNMLFCVSIKYGFYIHLKVPLEDAEASDSVHIDTNRLSLKYNLVSDIERGIHGKLF